MTVPVDLEDRLAGWFSDHLRAEVVVRDLRRHAEGFSWQTYTLTAAWTDADGPRERGFAVRRQPEDGLLAPYDVVRQYEVHRAVLDHSDVPIPGLVALETDPTTLGMPFYVMDRVVGHVPVQWRPDDPVAFPTPEARRALGHQFVRVLASIHAIDWRAAGLNVLSNARGAEDAALEQIDHWERYYVDAALIEVPLVRAAVAWLRSHVAVSDAFGLCHGDYRLGNVMIRDAAIVAVFDWELAHLSDPVEDLAYAGLGLFRGRSPLLSHLLPRDEMLAAFTEASGVPVDDDVFRFWTVLGDLKALAPHLRGSRAFEDGRNHDLRLAAMGHQSLHVLRILAVELGLAEAGP